MAKPNSKAAQATSIGNADLSKALHRIELEQSAVSAMFTYMRSIVGRSFDACGDEAEALLIALESMTKSGEAHAEKVGAMLQDVRASIQAEAAHG